LLPGLTWAIVIRTGIMLIVSSLISYKLRGTNWPFSAQKEELTKNTILTIGSSIVGTLFLGSGGALTFIALYTVVYRIFSELWALFLIDLAHPRTVPIVIRRRESEEKVKGVYALARDEIKTNIITNGKTKSVKVHRRDIKKIVEGILDQDVRRIERTYKLDVNKFESVAPLL
jgi:hypothetical protein